jgi:DNA-binding transcriptional ArsR family regulator
VPRQELDHSKPHDLPHDQRPQRQRIPPQTIGLSLRAEEIKLLLNVGRFRVISSRDLAETIYDNRRSRFERDLAYLKQQGLVEVDAVQARRDGRRGRGKRIEVVTLSRAGKEMANQISRFPKGQKLYAGLVKPREVEHDAQIYRAYRKEAQRIENAGGTNLRVQLDFELKANIQKAIYAVRRENPERDIDDIKQQVARDFHLPFVNGGIQIPDARIEYDLEGNDGQDLGQGSRTGHQDIEVLTAAYRPAHLRNKAQAGFHVYASASDRATLTAKIEDDHHLLENILEL